MNVSVSKDSWPEANQRYLVAALRMVRGALEKHRLRSEGKNERALETAVANELSAAAKALPAPSALERLCAAFGLSPFERDILLLCAGIELDSTFSTACAAAQGDPRKNLPTFGLALAALPDPHWSALSPGAPLRHWRLIELKGGD